MYMSSMLCDHDHYLAIKLMEICSNTLTQQHWLGQSQNAMEISGGDVSTLEPVHFKVKVLVDADEYKCEGDGCYICE